MKKLISNPLIINSLSEAHHVFGLPKPLHPLLSFFDLKEVSVKKDEMRDFFVLNFYKIAYKKSSNVQARYGQNYYDFGEDGLIFTAPGQSIEKPPEHEVEGKILLHSPRFFSFLFFVQNH